jgi:hypothetical protein
MFKKDINLVGLCKFDIIIKPCEHASACILSLSSCFSTYEQRVGDDTKKAQS